MSVKTYFPKFSVSWATTQSGVRVSAIIPTYYEIKNLATNLVILKQFDTQGGTIGSDNYPAEFALMLDAGNYEVTMKLLHRNRLFAQVFVMRGDVTDSNSSNSMQFYKEVKAGMEIKFSFTVSEYNPGGTQYYRLYYNTWFENNINHQFSLVNPSPPSSGTLGSLTENQYYLQETFLVSQAGGILTWNSLDVPELDTSTAGLTIKRATLPNTATIEIINPNVNAGIAQQVNNPFYINAGGPDVPVIISPSGGKMSIGSTISGSTTNKYNSIIVYRNGEEIGSLTPVGSVGDTGTWSYKPTTPQIYKFKARKDGLESTFTETVQVTISCNISNNQNILIWNETGQYLRAKTFDAITYYLCKIINESPLSFEVRGVNMLDRSDVTAIGGVNLPALKACFSNSETGVGGLVYDPNFITPAGYTKVGNTYVQNAGSVPNAPVPTSNTGTVGTNITGTGNQPGFIEVFKDGVKQATNIVTAGSTNSWTYNPAQPGKFTFKLVNDNGTSEISIEVNIAPVIDISTRVFRAKNVNYCTITPANVQSGYSTTGNAADVAEWVDGIVITTPVNIVPGTKGFIRDKTDHSKISVGVKLLN